MAKSSLVKNSQGVERSPVTDHGASAYVACLNLGLHPAPGQSFTSALCDHLDTIGVPVFVGIEQLASETP